MVVYILAACIIINRYRSPTRSSADRQTDNPLLVTSLSVPPCNIRLKSHKLRAARQAHPFPPPASFSRSQNLVVLVTVTFRNGTSKRNYSLLHTLCPFYYVLLRGKGHAGKSKEKEKRRPNYTNTSLCVSWNGLRHECTSPLAAGSGKKHIILLNKLLTPQNISVTQH